MESFKHAKLNFQEIRNFLNNYNSIKNYNLTIRNFTTYNSKKFNKYFYDIEFIFYNKYIEMHYNSNQLNTKIDGLIVSDISKLFEIYNEYNYCSKRLYDMINS